MGRQVNSTLENILGFDPNALQLRQQQQLLAPIAQAQNPYERMGAAIGTALGAGLFDIQDPRLKRASQVTGIYNDVMKNFDVSSPGTAYEQLAQRLASAGFGPEATFAASEASKYRTKPELQKVGDTLVRVNPDGTVTELYKAPEKVESPFAKIDPSKVTPDSLKVFQTTGKITDLVFKPDTDKGTEFERLIASLPPAEQAQARQNYLRKLTGQVMPPALVNLTMQEADAVGSLKTTINNVDRTLNDLTSGKLKLGVGKNFLNEFKTLAGKGGEESIAYNNFNATLTELQNKALLLNKGTQTEGDAIRALNEFMSNYARYDTNTAIERLQRVAEKFKAAEASKRNAIVALGQRYNEDLSPFLPERGPAVRPQAISDDIIRREFNKPENAGWQSRGFEAFKKKFLELNK